jgi:hypothetical protein
MARDEAYIIDLCDRVIGMAALRQHRFAFLLGDQVIDGRGHGSAVMRVSERMLSS